MVKYCQDSARFIYGDSLGDETADEILRQLRARPDSMTRTELRDHFQRNRSASELGRALGVLQEYGLARVERRRESEEQIKFTEPNCPKCASYACTVRTTKATTPVKPAALLGFTEEVARRVV